MKLLLTLLAVCVCTSSAMLCPLYCTAVLCPEVSEEICASQSAVLKPNATYCGCCHTCILATEYKYYWCYCYYYYYYYRHYY